MAAKQRANQVAARAKEMEKTEAKLKKEHGAIPEAQIEVILHDEHGGAAFAGAPARGAADRAAGASCVSVKCTRRPLLVGFRAAHADSTGAIIDQFGRSEQGDMGEVERSGLVQQGATQTTALR